LEKNKDNSHCLDCISSYCFIWLIFLFTNHYWKWYRCG